MNEIYWEIISVAVRIIDFIITGYLFSQLISHFILKPKCAKAVGIAYFVTMMIFNFIPYEFDSIFVYLGGIFAAFLTVCYLDRRNFKQKIFLSLVMYLVAWIARSIAIVPEDIITMLVEYPNYISTSITLLFVCFVFEQIIYVAALFVFMAFQVKLIEKVYVCKNEDLSTQELGLMLAPLLSVMFGYWGFHYFSNIYTSDTGSYIWNEYIEYNWIKTLYQIISYVSIVVVIVFYQQIKENNRKDKENALLSEQMASMESHIKEVESLYRDIRGIKHDMRNHVTILERLICKNEQQEAAKYISNLKENLNKIDTEIKSGNPIMDVLLTQKQKLAQENGIEFTSNFYYPEGTKLNAFDVSVILNNALDNAIEAAKENDNPYIHIKSYRKKNAYIIEISNSFSGKILIDNENGLPQSTKTENEHGYGLLNIRKVAHKYFGEIDITQNGNEFKLGIMLMLE
jgi:sensor histidine kinase YesM